MNSCPLHSETNAHLMKLRIKDQLYILLLCNNGWIQIPSLAFCCYWLAVLSIHMMSILLFMIAFHVQYIYMNSLIGNMKLWLLYCILKSLHYLNPSTTMTYITCLYNHSMAYQLCYSCIFYVQRFRQSQVTFVSLDCSYFWFNPLHLLVNHETMNSFSTTHMATHHSGGTDMHFSVTLTLWIISLTVAWMIVSQIWMDGDGHDNDFCSVDKANSPEAKMEEVKESWRLSSDVFPNKHPDLPP